jgi:hypothetical protein
MNCIERQILKTRSNIKKYTLRALFVCALSVPFIVTKISHAGFTDHSLVSHVEIEGVNYGQFDFITDLKPLLTQGADKGSMKVTLKRDFVTDPSLYLWAKNTTQGRTDLKNVHVVMETPNGEEIKRYTLKFVQPLSWTVEATNPALGGFHEQIEIAVQQISVR